MSQLQLLNTTVQHMALAVNKVLTACCERLTLLNLMHLLTLFVLLCRPRLLPIGPRRRRARAAHGAAGVDARSRSSVH